MNLFLFDLDGTLVESKTTILKACQDSLRQHSKSCPPDEEIIRSIGLPIGPIIRDFCGDDFDSVMKTFRKLILEYTPATSEVFPEVKHVLSVLQSQGSILKVVTNKTSDLATSVLESLELIHYFQEVIGIDLGRPKPNNEMLIYAARGWQGSIPIMIGDRIEDLLAAENAGFSSVLISRDQDLDENSFGEIRGLLGVVRDFGALLTVLKTT